MPGLPAILMLFVALCLLLWTGNSHAAPTPPPTNQPNFVFRGDRRDPETIKKAQGFLPFNKPSSPEAYSIYYHEKGEERNTNSAYVSTSYKFGTAAIYARRSGPDGWVYRIKATKNIINVAETLGRHYDGLVEAEFSALGGVRWDQVESYWKVPNGFKEDENLGTFKNTDYQAVSSQFIKSVDYDEKKYAQDVASAGQPQLAGFPEGHQALLEKPWSDLASKSTQYYVKEFMASIGTPNGWLEQYPLLFPALEQPSPLPEKKRKKQSQPEAPAPAPEQPPPLPDKKGRKDMQPESPSTEKDAVKESPGDRPSSASEKEKQAAKEPEAPVPAGKDGLRRAKTGPSLKRPSARKQPPKYVFRGDFLYPAEVEKQNGFLLEADFKTKFPSDAAYGIAGHLEEMAQKQFGLKDSVFVATSENLGTAAKWAAESAQRATGSEHSGMVYLVAATDNMVDVSQTLLEFYKTPAEQEVVVVGGIPWSQVKGWFQLPPGYVPPAQEATKKEALTARFNKAMKEKTPIFEVNPKYDKKFDNADVRIRGHPELLGSDIQTPIYEQEPWKSVRPLAETKNEDRIKKFMDENGKAVGWSGKFPLFEPPSRISAKDSAAAKAHKEVEAPHKQAPEGWLNKSWSFLKSHPVAMALLPAVVAANLIPGVGEVADAAELTALGVGAVEDAGLLAAEGVEVAEGVGEAESVGEIAAEAAPKVPETPEPELKFPKVLKHEPKDDIDFPEVPTHDPGASAKSPAARPKIPLKAD